MRPGNSSSLFAEWEVDLATGKFFSPPNDLHRPGQVVLFDNPVKDGSISASITPLRGQWSNNAGGYEFRECAMMFRYTDSEHFYVAGMGGFAQKFFIAKVLPSGWQLLANTGHAKDLHAHVPYHMRVEFHGHRIQLFHNDVLVLSASDSTYSSGLCGLHTNRTEARFENVDLAAVRTSEHEIDQASTQISQAMTYPENKNVFIVHGHDEAKKWELKNFLTGLGVHPIVLHEQDDLGKTIIEKFEHYASQSAFAIILMTPDDQTPAAFSVEAKWRARQNVIMELGWFMAKLGRNRVVVLYKGNLEIPSDIYGVIYLEFRTSVQEVSEKIRQRLQGVGLIP